MDKEKYLQELLRWVSSDSLLVLDDKGNLRRLYCPFKVICLVNFPDINKGDKVSVDAIKLTVEVREVYDDEVVLPSSGRSSENTAADVRLLRLRLRLFSSSDDQRGLLRSSRQ